MGKVKCEKYYYDSGNLAREDYRFKGELHREDGPAIIDYYESGELLRETYYRNGTFHREDGPADIKYFKCGGISCEEYYWNGGRISEHEFKVLYSSVEENNVDAMLIYDAVRDKICEVCTSPKWTHSIVYTPNLGDYPILSTQILAGIRDGYLLLLD